MKSKTRNTWTTLLQPFFILYLSFFPFLPPFLSCSLSLLWCFYFDPVFHSSSPPLWHDSFPLSVLPSLFSPRLACKAFVANWLAEGVDRCCMPWLRALISSLALPLFHFLFLTLPMCLAPFGIPFVSPSCPQSVSEECNLRWRVETLSFFFFSIWWKILMS